MVGEAKKYGIPKSTLHDAWQREQNPSDKSPETPAPKNALIDFERDKLYEWYNYAVAKDNTPTISDLVDAATHILYCRGASGIKCVDNNWAYRFRQECGLTETRAPRSRDQDRTGIIVDRVYNYFEKVAKLIQEHRPAWFLFFDEIGFHGYNKAQGKRPMVVNSQNRNSAYRIVSNKQRACFSTYPFDGFKRWSKV